MEVDPRRLVVFVTTGLDIYQAPLIDGACRVLRDEGYSVVAHISYRQSGALPPQLACLLEHWSPAGVITTCCASPEQDLALRRVTAERGIPTVHLAQRLPGRTCIQANNVQGMTAMMEHLLDEQEVRVASLVRGWGHHPDHVEREQVFRAELARRGLPVDEELVVEGGDCSDAAFRSVRSLLSRRPDVQALVTMDDWTATAVLGAIAEPGLRVPEDVAVTGFDNYPIGVLTWPGITTVDQNLTRQGAAAAAALLELVAGAAPGEHHQVPCSLIRRGSTLRRGRGVGDPLSARDVTKLAQSHLADQSALMRISRSLIECRTLDDVCAALVGELNPLGIHRCFLVLYQDQNPTGHPIADGHEPARLLVDYRDRQALPVPDGTFTSCLLPENLQHELRDGFLAVQAIIVGRQHLGYLVLEQLSHTTSIAETLRLDIGKALKSALDTRELQGYSLRLEELVEQRTGELQRRTDELEQRTRELDSEVILRRRAERDVHQANDELQRINGQLQRSLVVDSLTQIANRRAFHDHLERQWTAHADNQATLSVIMVDVDLFKAYNDRYGHLAGDEALRTVASCLERSTHRVDDLACRFGGEEFVVLLPRTEISGALVVARRFRRLLAQAVVPHEASDVAPVLTVSIGVATLAVDGGVTAETLVSAADNALYRAKEQGRNRIEVAPSVAPASPGTIPRQRSGDRADTSAPEPGDARSPL
ncbi:MAG: GGDEF domain-containing protein [Actinomycetales bacterium]|nr:GGDEF domain-containing protein [Actinomycetales bacterium]